MRITKCVSCGMQLAYTEDYRNETTKRWSVCDECEAEKQTSAEHFEQNSIEANMQGYQKTHVNETLATIQQRRDNDSHSITDERLQTSAHVSLARFKALLEYQKLQDSQE